MRKTMEASDNEKTKSLPQSIYIAASLLLEWAQQQIQIRELDEIECQQSSVHNQVQDEEWDSP